MPIHPMQIIAVSLNRRPAWLLRRLSPHLGSALQDRAAYSSVSRRKPSNRKPTLVSRPLPASKTSKTSSAQGNNAGGPTAPGTPTNAGNPRCHNSRTLSPSPIFRSTPGTPARTDPVTPKSRAPLIPRGKATSREYKSASRKWVACIIALPVFIVTSYHLFDRCMLALGLARRPSFDFC